MSRTNWKSFERRVAKDLDTCRVLMKGMAVPDVIKELPQGDILVDCKAVKDLRLEVAMSKLREYSEQRNKETVLVICHRRNGEKTVHTYLPLFSLLRLYNWAGYYSFSFAEMANRDRLHKINTTVQVCYDWFKKLVRSAEDVGVFS